MPKESRPWRPGRTRIRSRGFTILELLFVVAIVSLMFSMLLPAVMQTREAARRYSCRNNLIQIGLALQNYETAHERLPPGTVNPTGPIRSETKGYHVSWLVQILPQLDQPSVYSHFNFAVGVYDSENLSATRCGIPYLSCPSSPLGGVMGALGSVGNYVGCHHDVEAPIDVDNHGVLYLNSRIRYRDIHDGAATTIFVGECGGDTLGWASGTRGSLRNTGGPINGGQIPAGMALSPPPSVAGLDSHLLAVGGFSSSHPGGANFLFGDGSVRFVNQMISQDVFRSLAHRADGNLPGEF